MPPDPQSIVDVAFGFIILVVLAVLLYAGMWLWYLDRQDARQTELKQDLVEAVTRASGPEALAAVTTLIQLEYGDHGSDRLSLMVELMEAKTQLLAIQTAQQGTVLAEIGSSTGKLRRSLRELPAAAKRYLP